MSSTTKHLPSNRLTFKLTILLACLLSVVLLGFTLAVINWWVTFCINSTISETERFVDTLTRSAKYSMMHAHGEALHATINAVGDQKDIEWVRIFNKDGRITYSTDQTEIGTVLDKKAEACYGCHGAGEPLEHLPGKNRSRVFTSLKKKHRVLATISPIYNEPSCSTAKCHVHPKSKRILGVLDVAMSLAPTDALIRERSIRVALLGLAGIALVSTIVAVFLHRYIGLPIRKLLRGTKKIANSQFGHRIPRVGNDELSELADSFNRMTESLGKAYTELEGLAETLEQRVTEKSKELHSAQLQVIRAEKLASLGRLAAGVAHELNNPLTGVLTFIHLAARKLPKDSQEYADLQVSIAETNRCSKIIKDLLLFARESTVRQTPENLNEIVRQILTILKPQALFHNIRIETKLAEPLPKVTVDSAQIKQVLLNIILNAAEAMAGSGDLTITTSVSPSGMATIAIADNGEGIQQDHLDKIFDPFFTTKDPGKGTGLGLAVSLKLIETHGGTIKVTSELGRGSTFRVLLPLHPKTDNLGEPHDVANPHPGD